MINGIVFHIFCLIVVIALVVIYFSKPHIKTVESRFYSALVFSNMFGLLLHIFQYYTITHALEIPALNTVITKLYLVYVTMWYIIFILYVVRMTSTGKIFNKFFALVSIITIVAIFWISISPIHYYNGADGVYTFGSTIDFIYSTFYINIFLLLVYLLINLKKVKTKRYIPVFIMIFLGSIVIFIQQNYPTILLITALHTFVIFVMYFTIENPDIKMIQKLNMLKDQADKANRAKSDFLSSMSHEIRTPLNAIVGFSECIKQEKKIEECYSDADDIIMASQNLLEIVNGILDISKIEANKMEIVVTNYRPKPIFENLAKLIVPRIGEKPIELNVHITDDLPDVLQGDAGKLKQVTTNVLTNAVKYTRYGYIDFSVKCINTDDESKLIISIQDTGRGIKPDQMNKLFKKFERLDEDRNTTVEGTGLGLAITKQLIEMMGGTISVQSRYGEGTKFTICLKQKIVKDEKEKAKLINTMNIPIVNFGGKKVMIVDDNNLNIKVCSKLLAQYNVDITSVDSGFECIEILKNDDKFDLILMDDMMPKMSGPETLANLKKEFPDYNIPTVVLTANNIHEKRDKYLADGFDNCLAKPIEKVELHKILTEYLTKEGQNTQKLEVNKLETELDLTGKKILLVDDNNLNLKVEQNILKIYNPTIESVTGGKECLEIVKSNSYDLILMDDMMPVMSGTETMKILKQEENYTKPIVVLTANAVEGAKEHYLKEGFDDYLSKPINKQELLRVLSTYISSENTPQPIEITDDNHFHTKNFLAENDIDVEKALKSLKTIDAYNDMVNDFLKDISNKVIRINQYRLSRNMNNYIMEMHALMGDCKCLGIYSLYAIANNHEQYAKENNYEFIDNNFDQLMQEINRVVTVLKKYR